MAERSLLSMALDINTEILALREVLAAFAGLQKLVECTGDEEDPDLPLERAELHGLLSLMNGGLHRQAEMLEDTVCSLLLALRTAPPMLVSTP